MVWLLDESSTLNEWWNRANRTCYPHERIPGLRFVRVIFMLVTCGWLFLLISWRERRHERKSREREMDIKTPRIKKRGPRLSVEVVGDEKSWALGRVKRRKMLKQQESVLFKLPFEIRELLYKEYFMEGREIAITAVSARGKLEAWNVHRGEYLAPVWGDRPKEMEQVILEQRPNILGLIVTCRRTYLEAITYLYRMPTFLFMDPLSFAAFYAAVLPSRVEVMRDVVLDFVTPHSDELEHYCAIDLYRANLSMPAYWWDLKCSSIKTFYNTLPQGPMSPEEIRALYGPLDDPSKTGTYFGMICRILPCFTGLRNIVVIFSESHQEKIGQNNIITMLSDCITLEQETFYIYSGNFCGNRQPECWNMLEFMRSTEEARKYMINFEERGRIAQRRRNGSRVVGWRIRDGDER